MEFHRLTPWETAMLADTSCPGQSGSLKPRTYFGVSGMCRNLSKCAASVRLVPPPPQSMGTGVMPGEFRLGTGDQS